MEGIVGGRGVSVGGWYKKNQVPKVLIMCSGPIANQKIGIENYMLIDYNVENCLV